MDRFTVPIDSRTDQLPSQYRLNPLHCCNTGIYNHSLKKAKADGDKGANARAAVRLLEKYRNEGDLLSGVELKEEGILKITHR